MVAKATFESIMYWSTRQRVFLYWQADVWVHRYPVLQGIVGFARYSYIPCLSWGFLSHSHLVVILVNCALICFLLSCNYLYNCNLIIKGTWEQRSTPWGRLLVPLCMGSYSAHTLHVCSTIVRISLRNNPLNKGFKCFIRRVPRICLHVLNVLCTWRLSHNCWESMFWFARSHF